jgi:DNA-directed RNA polymerase subunit delta
MHNDLSLIDAAVVILQNNKKPHNLYELFDAVTEGRNLSEDQKSDLITSFYADLTTSAKFVYAGNSEWDLKANQKIELWEKDGSFYKEYNVVELPDEYKEKPKPVKAKPVKAPKIEVVEEPAIDVVEEVVVAAVVEPEAEEKFAAKTTEAVVETPDVIENYEEEVFEEYDEFDEDKYNEYMDSYEDQYEK